MAKLADYKVLFAGRHYLEAGWTNDKGKLRMRWVPPKRFVEGTGQARPLLTWQFWTKATSRYTVSFEPDNLGQVTDVHERGNIEAGQLHIGSHILHGPHFGSKGWITIAPAFIKGQPSKFNVELVKIDFQVRR